jgi:carbon monoxide dehydrogenase subunit G
MRVTYSGVIAAAPDDAWARISDLDMIIGLLPGATLRRDGDRVVGSVKVRPSAQVTYRITCGASVEAEAEQVATIAVTGAEARGDGTLAATLTVAVRREDGGSGLVATADIEATGRAADADEHGWSRVLAGLGNAVVASFERYPAGTAVTTPKPESAPTLKPAPVPVAVEAPAPTRAPEPAPPVAPPSRAIDAPPQSKVPMVIGVIVVLLVLRSIRKRRRSR